MPKVVKSESRRLGMIAQGFEAVDQVGRVNGLAYLIGAWPDAATASKPSGTV